MKIYLKKNNHGENRGLRSSKNFLSDYWQILALFKLACWIVVLSAELVQVADNCSMLYWWIAKSWANTISNNWCFKLWSWLAGLVCLFSCSKNCSYLCSRLFNRLCWELFHKLWNPKIWILRFIRTVDLYIIDKHILFMWKSM